MPPKALKPNRKKYAPNSTAGNTFTCNLPVTLIRDFNVEVARRSITQKQNAVREALWLWISTRYQAGAAVSPPGTANITVPRWLLTAVHACLLGRNVPACDSPYGTEQFRLRPRRRIVARRRFSFHMDDKTIYGFTVAAAQFGYTIKQDAVEDAIGLWVATPAEEVKAIVNSETVLLNVPRTVAGAISSVLAAFSGNMAAAAGAYDHVDGIGSPDHHQHVQSGA